MMRNITIFIVKVVSKWLNPYKLPVCRFFPSCTSYAGDSIRKYGILRGTCLASIRLLKCQPLFRGGFDPVP